MTTTDEWVTNNPTFDPSQVDGGYTFLLYLSVVVAALVLTHSWATHWQKPRYTATRVQTEVAATALLASSTLALVAQADGVAGGALGAVLVYDFFYLGVLNVVVQLCDLYMFFSRFQAVCRVTPHTRVRIQVRHHRPSQPSRRCALAIVVKTRRTPQICHLSWHSSHQAYIWLCCVVPRFPTFNIVPGFYDTNSPLYAYAFGISNR